MSRLVVVIELDDENGAKPQSVNRHAGRRGYGRFTGEVRDWKSTVAAATIVAIEALTGQERTYLLDATGEADGWSVDLEWAGKNPTFGLDLDNVHKLVQDGVWTGLKWFRSDVATDRWVNLIGGEIVDRPRLKRGEPDQRFLQITIERRRRGALTREQWEARKQGAARNAAVEKLSA